MSLTYRHGDRLFMEPRFAEDADKTQLAQIRKLEAENAKLNTDSKEQERINRTLRMRLEDRAFYPLPDGL